MTRLALVWWGLRVYGPTGIAALARRLRLPPAAVYAACYRLRELGHATHCEWRRRWDASGKSRESPPYDSPGPGLFAGRAS